MEKHKWFLKIMAIIMVALMVLGSCFTLIYYLVNYVFK